ncbi:MAG: tetratricopeptide repeat protein [Terracoccus sp.]
MLNNIGVVYHRRREGDTALTHFNQALPIQREVGDRVGEANTRYNIAMTLRADGRLVEAVAQLELVVELERAVQHPDLESDTATLEQVRTDLARQAARTKGPTNERNARE